MAPSEVPNLEAAQTGSNNGKTKESEHRSDSAGEWEVLLIDPDSDANPDIDRVLVLEKGLSESEFSNTTQESLEAFMNTNHAFRDSIQTQVDTLLMAVQALMGMSSPMGPSPIPPLGPAPAPTTGNLAGPAPSDRGLGPSRKPFSSVRKQRTLFLQSARGYSSDRGWWGVGWVLCNDWWIFSRSWQILRRTGLCRYYGVPAMIGLLRLLPDPCIAPPEIV